MARLDVPAPGLLTGVTSEFAPLTASLQDPSLNGVTQPDGSSVIVNADGSFVYTPPTRNGARALERAQQQQQRNATIKFRVTDANGDALEEAVAVIIDGALKKAFCLGWT
jgi:VCBS repeat-containing protein